MCGSASVGSVSYGSRGTTVLSSEKRLHISAVKPMCVIQGSAVLGKNGDENRPSYTHM